MLDNDSFLQAGRSLPELGALKQMTHNWEFSDGELVLYSCLVFTLVLIGRRTLSPAQTQWHHAKSTLQLRHKDGRKTRLSELCQSLTPPFYLRPWMFNNHVQTIMSMFGYCKKDLYFRRIPFESDSQDYQGSFEVDFAVDPHLARDPQLPPRTAYYSIDSRKHIGSDDSRPMLIALHGLCGGSHEQYLQSVLAPLKKGKEWEACVLLSRGCGESTITGGGMYYAHATNDLRQTVKWLQKNFPNRPLYAIGFSMGANILTRYIAEEGSKCIFRCAVVLSNPWNLELAAVRLQKTFSGRWLYSPAMTANLLKVFRKAKKVETIHGEPFSKEEASRVTLMHEYDRYIQCPTWGFPTERVYYRKASSSDAVLDVKIPFWAINAEDDPIAGDESIPKGEFEVKPYTVLCTTEYGGHLGWFQTDGGRWYSEPVVSFFRTMHECEVDEDGEDSKS